MNRFTQSILAISTVSLATLGMAFSTQAATIVAPTLSLHNAPANGAAVTSTIAQGTKVDIGVCNSAWCYITAGNQKGWVETNKLSNKLSNKLAAVNNSARSMSTSGGAGSAATTGSRTESATLNISITIVPEGSQEKASHHSGINVNKIAPEYLR